MVSSIRFKQAFINTGGYQCGFCTPGFIMASKALIDENPDRSEEESDTPLAGISVAVQDTQRFLKRF